MRVAVVIPTLNEGRLIGAAVADVLERGSFADVIVVDGGSEDATARVARAAGARVIEAPRSRAAQQNAGAAATDADALLFLHADVTLPAGAADVVRDQLRRKGASAGAFRTWHRPERWTGWRARLLHLADLRSRYSSLPYGDQAIHVRADVFSAVGGFPEIGLMEDLALARALRQRGRILISDASVSVSARRFEDAALYQTALVNVFPTLYHLGVPPRLLARLYGNPR